MISILRCILRTFPKKPASFVCYKVPHKCSSSMAFKYPDVRRDESVKDVYHGVEVSDPYRWLEDPTAEETKTFVDAQNAVTRPYLESLSFREELRQNLTKLWNYPKFYQPFRHGKMYYQFRNSGLQNQNVIYTQESLDAEAKVFLDPNEFSDNGTISLQGIKFSEDGKTLAYGLSTDGSDWLEIHFKDVESGKNYDEVLKKVKFTCMSWMHDNKGFFYCAYLDQEGTIDGSETDSNKNQKLYYHQLGTNQSKDVAVVAFDDPQLRISCNVSYCGEYLVVTAIKGCKSNLVYFANLKKHGETMSMLDLTPVVTVLECDYEYITNNGSKFLFRTNKNAPNYKIIEVDFNKPAESEWTTLIAEDSKDVLESCKPINGDQMILLYLRDVKHTMHLHDLKSGKKILDCPLEMGSIFGISGKRDHKELFFGFTSLLKPTTIYRIDFTKDPMAVTVHHETKLGDFDPTNYVSKQVFYESKDGTRVPMFLMHKKDFVQDGTRPCLLYGYGGFNINLIPSFSVSRLLFVTKFNGVFALPNIRGGGEYGDKWHNGGRFENKQNCFDDFQSAAKYLVDEKYTAATKISIQGGSNGGLLVAACINQAPQLFGAAICQVGVMDMLRFHKFTIGYAWKSDYGCSDEKEQFEYLYKYSPLHNVKVPASDVQYPATLLLTADHDDRVVPLHSFKMIAELQHKLGKLPQQKNPIMAHIETHAGHGAGKPTSKIINEIVDIFCFIGKSLQLSYN